MDDSESRINEQTQVSFQQTLLSVEESLSQADVQALVFLCADLLRKDVSYISTGRDLFTQLQELDLLTPERQSLLAELLCIIKRNALLSKLGLNTLRPEGLVSPYRKLLFDLSENITADEFKRIKFQLYRTLPHRKLEDSVTMLNLLLEMEKEDRLSNTNLDTLENLIENVCPSLRRKITQYKEESRRVIQETGVPYVRARQPQPEESSFHPGVQTQPYEGASSYERSAKFGCVQECNDQYQPSRRQGFLTPSYFCTTQPQALSQEYDARSSPLSSTSPASTDTLDARMMEGMSLSQQSCNGKSESGLSSVQTHSASLASSCEEKNLSAAEPSPGKKKEIEPYAMKEDRTRGICLIINNYDFSKSSFESREGTAVDETCLVKVFDWLGFETRVERDCTQQRMRALLDELGREDHGGRDCVACCVLSHGRLRGVYGVDGGGLFLKDFTEPFSGERCVSLRGKPKLFFIQACQGNRKQKPVSIKADCSADTDPDPDLDLDPEHTADAVVPEDSIPSVADYLLGMATVPEYVAYRDEEEGTWFIQSLCENLVQLVPEGHDLDSILIKVKDDVSKMTDDTGKKKQMPMVTDCLRKRVIFPVPKQPPPQLKIRTKPEPDTLPQSHTTKKD